MRIFLSWSGKPSREVALAFRDWLPQVIQSVVPYVSSEDIEKGAPWSPELDNALTESRFSIICLTADNQDSRWLNFEAGVLSRSIENPKAHVCPFLFNLVQADVEGPLTRFQSTRNERDEVKKLIHAINNAEEERKRLRLELLEKSFTTYWPELQTKLAEVVKNYAPVAPKPARKEMDILGEILDLARANQRLAATKDDVVPMMRQFENLLRHFAEMIAIQGSYPFSSPVAAKFPTAYGLGLTSAVISQGGVAEITEPSGPLHEPNTEKSDKAKKI